MTKQDKEEEKKTGGKIVELKGKKEKKRKRKKKEKEKKKTGEKKTGGFCRKSRLGGLLIT